MLGKHSTRHRVTKGLKGVAAACTTTLTHHLMSALPKSDCLWTITGATSILSRLTPDTMKCYSNAICTSHRHPSQNTNLWLPSKSPTSSLNICLVCWSVKEVSEMIPGILSWNETENYLSQLKATITRRYQIPLEAHTISRKIHWSD